MSGIPSFRRPNSGAKTSPRSGDDLPPDWRWQRAVTLAREGRRPTRHDDPLVRQAYQYLKWLGRASPRRSLPGRLRHIQLAHEIRESVSLISIALEAGALAGHAPEPLAASFAMPEELPTVLERLFFDVRDRLDDRDYIYAHEILPDLESSSEEDQDAALFKAVAYEFGWWVFEAVLLANMSPYVTLLSGQDTHRATMLRALGIAARRFWWEMRRKDGPVAALGAATAMIGSRLPVLEVYWEKAVRRLSALQLLPGNRSRRVVTRR